MNVHGMNMDSVFPFPPRFQGHYKFWQGISPTFILLETPTATVTYMDLD